VTQPLPGTLVGTGRNADVYDIGEGRVLRRYRDQRPPAAVAREGEVMVHARAHGVPVPEVFDVTGSDIVMERAAGPTMLDVMGRRPWPLREQATLLATLHAAVHRVPPLPWQPAPFADDAQEAAAEVLLHRDLHPQNVILTPDGPRIIDWEGAARGPALADVAMTWVIIMFSEVPGSRLQAAIARPLQARTGRAFLRAAGPVDRRWLEIAVRHRIGDKNLLPSERTRLERQLRKLPGTLKTGSERRANSLMILMPHLICLFGTSSAGLIRNGRISRQRHIGITEH
jgi:aminoglycoside phosphotransferase (APT) family kinase protein